MTENFGACISLDGHALFELIDVASAIVIGLHERIDRTIYYAS